MANQYGRDTWRYVQNVTDQTQRFTHRNLLATNGLVASTIGMIRMTNGYIYCPAGVTMVIPTPLYLQALLYQPWAVCIDEPTFLSQLDLINQQVMAIQRDEINALADQDTALAVVSRWDDDQVMRAYMVISEIVAERQLDCNANQSGGENLGEEMPKGEGEEVITEPEPTPKPEPVPEPTPEPETKKKKKD